MGMVIAAKPSQGSRNAPAALASTPMESCETPTTADAAPALSR